MNSMKKIKIPGDTIIIPMFIGCGLIHFSLKFTNWWIYHSIVKGAGPLVGAFSSLSGVPFLSKTHQKAVGRGAAIILQKLRYLSLRVIGCESIQ